jgi:uncharacterized protein
VEPPSRTETRRRLGVLTHGSLTAGMEMKLEPGRSVETVRAGTFCVVSGQAYDFFSMVTDVEIAAANERILLHPPGADDEILREVMQGAGTYATVHLKPMLMLEQGVTEQEPRPVKTVPAHFATVGEATAEDVARVFGAEAQDRTRFFEVGHPLDMETPVCLDLARFVERSNAVFGKTGTGKSFTTRVLLAGAIKTGRAVTLIFDMHNEYGYAARQEGDARRVPGLKQLFPDRVRVFSLDPASTRRRGQSADTDVHLYADQVEPEDVLPLRETLNLTATAAESTFSLRKHFGDRWLIELLAATSERIETMADETGTHAGSLAALKRKLDRLDGLEFFRKESSTGRRDVVDELLESISAGKSVVLEFGQHNSLLVYLLVANVITRRLRDRYERMAEEHEADPERVAAPRQLLITIEEAHKFLGPQTAKETPFGKIAREMRKFSVSLLIVDQRPSGIDEEVLSQIGTKFVAQLNDEKDIAAALVGTSGATALRQVLATLESKRQALVLGHAVPMPVVVETRAYDDAFFAAVRDRLPARTTAREVQAETDSLFG